MSGWGGGNEAIAADAPRTMLDDKLVDLCGQIDALEHALTLLERDRARAMTALACSLCALALAVAVAVWGWIV